MMVPLVKLVDEKGADTRTLCRREKVKCLRRIVGFSCKELAQISVTSIGKMTAPPRI